MKLMTGWLGLVLVLALATAGCSGGDDAATPAASTTPSGSAEPSPDGGVDVPTTAATLPARAQQSEAEREKLEETYVLWARSVIDFGSTTDVQLVAAGDAACDALDKDVDQKFAMASALVELSDDAADYAAAAATAAAVRTLCPEHEGDVT